MLIGGGGALAASGSSDVALTTTTLPALHPGQTAWVSTLWRGAGSDAGSFVLRASGPAGISISYPANTGTYSSLYKEATLLADDTDYAAFKVVVGPDVVGEVHLCGRASAERCDEPVSPAEHATDLVRHAGHDHVARVPGGIPGPAHPPGGGRCRRHPRQRSDWSAAGRTRLRARTEDP